MKVVYRQPVARAIAVLYGVYLVYYLIWRATSTLNFDALAFSIGLLGIEASALVSFGLFAFMTWDVKFSSRFQFRPGPTADIFVPTYNEDVSILEATLVGCNGVTYPHTTYVLDDGRRPEVEQLARRLGCEYLTRADNAHAKAGNINAALQRTSGQFIAVLDADTIPQPDFFDKTLGYFTDEQVALVQLPQEFYNVDSVQHAPAAGAADLWHEQALFYRVIQPGKARWNASFWCGSPSVIRRAALQSIGGVATESITEDLQTTLRLHARGWKTVYHNEVLALGIAAQTLNAFGIQRLRWAQGTMQLLRSRENPLLLPGLSIPQRLSHLASMITYLEAYQKLAYLLAPPITLLTGMLPVRVGAGEFVLHWLPYFALGVLANVALGRASFRYVETERYNLLKMFTFIKASAILVRSGPLRFRVTPKQAGATPYLLEREQLRPHFVLLAVLAVGIGVGVTNMVWGLTARYADPGVALATLFWACASGGLLATTVVHILRRLHSRDEYRFPARVPGCLFSRSGSRAEVVTEDLSLRGCSVLTTPGLPIGTGTLLTLQLPTGSLTTGVEVMHEQHLPVGQHRLGIRFKAMSTLDREQLVEYLFVTFARHSTTGAALPEPFVEAADDARAA